MTGRLRIRRDFDWSCVVWSGPDEASPSACSRCRLMLAEDAVPLLLWNPEGACIALCNDCAESAMERA